MKRCLCFLLALILLLSLMPACAFAAGTNNLTVSDKLVKFIKSNEGSVIKDGLHVAYWDSIGEVWTIGYGHTGYVPCRGEAVKEGMTLTQQEADELLAYDLNSTYGKAVNDFADRYKSVYPNGFTQYQFDALTSMAFNFGTKLFVSDTWRFSRYLRNGFYNYTDAELADAIGCLWGNVDGLLRRRIAEAKIFLYNDYEGNGPHQFVYLKFSGAATVFSDDARSGNAVAIYIKGAPYGELPTANYVDGKGYFAGWKTSDGMVLKNADIASANLTVTATWSSTKPGVDPIVTTKCRYGANCPSKDFADIPSDYWAHAEIDYVVDIGLFRGTSTTAFSPDKEMTRAMLVTVLYRLANSPSVAGLKNEFPDVQKNAYYDAILWAHKNNIAHGFNDGTFRPNDPITREQFATFLQRFAANVYGMDTESAHYANLNTFSDASDVDSAYRESMSWAVGEGIIKGRTATTLDPNGFATRAQVAVILYRFTSNT